MTIATEVHTLEWLRPHLSAERVDLWRTLEAPTGDDMYGE